MFSSPFPIQNPAKSFTRPSNTTQYVVGQLVANATAAANVVPLSWTSDNLQAVAFFIRRVRLKKSASSLTSASFRAHFYGTSPAPQNGDGGAWSTTESTYLGAVDITCDKAFTDPAAIGIGVPNAGSEIAVQLGAGLTLYALVEARDVYTPASAEVFTVTLEDWPN